MDQQRFDEIARALASPRSRRGFLGAAMAALASAFSGAGASAAPNGKGPSRCYGEGSRCAKGDQCCSGTCTNRVCAAGAPTGCTPGTIEPCYTGPAETYGVGSCRAGTRMCLADGSGFGACVGQVLPQPEICNGLDDDCDGQIDTGLDCSGEVCVPGTRRPCYTGPDGTRHVGICRDGYQACLPDGSGFGSCEDDVLPGVESTCNGLDEDCDGTPDNGATCDPLPNAYVICAYGGCQVNGCVEGFGNCDGLDETGCETSLMDDPLNCGGCCNVCPGSPDGTAPACVNGACSVQCEPGYINCNGAAPDGCECPQSQGGVCTLPESCCIAYGYPVVEGFPCCGREDPNNPGYCGY